ncbi:MAG: transposase [Thermodesulfobacteriota bacterium]
MPRKSRIDATGALHHIMVRGIERRKIFENDTDRDQLVKRLGEILSQTKTSCYAWALLPNHFHLLLKTGGIPVSTIMRRLLTGYALWFNKTHRRHGHLFQNRFKSILCQEDPYLLELVRYIHLNPIRAGIVPDLEALSRYGYSGHSVLLGKIKQDWQDSKEILGMFSENPGSARRLYKAFVKEGLSEKKRPDLTGGGLIRSAGGWEAVKALQKERIFQRNDERILGDGDFVDQVLASAEEEMSRRYRYRAQGFDLEKVAARVSEVLQVSPEMVWARGRYHSVVEARSLFCFWAVRELGIPLSVLGRKLGLSLPAISKSVIRGQNIIKKQKFNLL